MDENGSARRRRVNAGASLAGATALLVLSFGPSALALSPSAPSAPTVRASVSAPAPAAVSDESPRRPADGTRPASP